MASIKGLINEVLYERTEQHLKIFYNIDVLLFPNQQEELSQQVKNNTPQPAANAQAVPAPVNEPAQTNPVTAPQFTPPAGSGAAFSNKVEEAVEQQQQAAPTQPKKETGERFRTVGYVVLQRDEAYNIQTIEDLIEFLSTRQTSNDIKGKKVNGAVVNDFVKEAVVLISQGAPINDLITKKDKFIVEIDYGFDKDNSIGFKINKMSGVGTMSISMKKD